MWCFPQGRIFSQGGGVFSGGSFHGGNFPEGGGGKRRLPKNMQCAHIYLYLSIAIVLPMLKYRKTSLFN